MTLRHTVNLGNSIIGVSILAMPYCFKKCGVLLSIVMILLSNLINRASCHLLLKSAILARRRNFELLAFHTFGSKGKLAVELGILGFLLGTCVAFFVVIGDIGPALVAEIFDIPNGPQLRAFVMTFLGMFVALPLGLLRRVESLTSFSILSLGLYAFLILKLFVEAVDSYWQAEQEIDLNVWNFSSFLKNLPIFSMALSCQTQLFEIFDHSMLNDMSMMKSMNRIVNRAINICSLVYISVGYLGYFAFFDKPFQGNILVFLPPSFVSTVTKVAFIFTVVISFPLCLFPCRTSLHSFLFKKNTLIDNPVSASSSSIHMSDGHFKLLTIVLIITTIGVSVLLPRIELVLGILGSTIGTFICFIFPATIFISLTEKNTNERLLAHLIGFIGVFILIGCTFSNLNNIYYQEISADISKINVDNLPDLKIGLKSKVEDIKPNLVVPNLDPEAIKKEEKEIHKEQKLPNLTETNKLAKEIEPPKKQVSISNDLNKMKRQEELLQRLEKQQQEHKKLLEQQKELLKEMQDHDEKHHPKQLVKSAAKESNKTIPGSKSKSLKKSVNASVPLKQNKSKLVKNNIPITKQNIQKINISKEISKEKDF